MQTQQDSNSAAGGQSDSTVGLERMFRVAKTDHPDLVGGIVWADCELAWINERITLAILAEREACADACEGQTEGFAATSTWDESALSCARTIRMRSNAKLTGVPPTDATKGG